MDELTGLQLAFCYEYVKDFNGTRACERAGYEGNENVWAVQAYHNLRNPKIRRVIKELVSANAMAANEVLARLADTARFDPSDYFVKKRSKIFVDLDKIKADGLGHIIKEISYDRHGHLVVKFDDRQAALLNIGRAHGLFTEKLELSGSVESKLLIVPPKE